MPQDTATVCRSTQLSILLFDLSSLLMPTELTATLLAGQFWSMIYEVSVYATSCRLRNMALPLYIGKSKTENQSLNISTQEGEGGSFKVSAALT